MQIMKTKVNINEICHVGLDLAKSIIQLDAVDRAGKKLMSHRFSRVKAIEFFQALRPVRPAFKPVVVRTSGLGFASFSSRGHLYFKQRNDGQYW